LFNTIEKSPGASGRSYHRTWSRRKLWYRVLRQTSAQLWIIEQEETRILCLTFDFDRAALQVDLVNRRELWRASTDWAARSEKIDRSIWETPRLHEPDETAADDVVRTRTWEIREGAQIAGVQNNLH